MQSIEFLEEKKRMCESFGPQCRDECPIYKEQKKENANLYSCWAFTEIYPVRVVNAVEKWSHDNPRMTNGQKFKEIFGRYFYEAEAVAEHWLFENYIEPGGKLNENLHYNPRRV